MNVNNLQDDLITQTLSEVIWDAFDHIICVNPKIPWCVPDKTLRGKYKNIYVWSSGYAQMYMYISSWNICLSSYLLNHHEQYIWCLSHLIIAAGPFDLVSEVM